MDDGCQVTSTALASTTQQFNLLPPIEGYLVTQVFYFALVVNPAAALTIAIHFVSYDFVKGLISGGEDLLSARDNTGGPSVKLEFVWEIKSLKL